MNELDGIKMGTANVKVEPIILQRWSPRAFSSKEISTTDLQSLFTAASWAASSLNEQPWRFVFGRKGDATYEKILGALSERNRSWAGSAPILLASFAKKTFTKMAATNTVAVHDTGAASANLSLQATALGIYTHGMAGIDHKKLAAVLNVPEDFEPVACWVMGYLGDPETLPAAFKELELQPRIRKPVNEFVYAAWDEPAQL